MPTGVVSTLSHPRSPPLRRWLDSDLYCWAPLSPLPGNRVPLSVLFQPLLRCRGSSDLSLDRERGGGGDGSRGENGRKVQRFSGWASSVSHPGVSGPRIGILEFLNKSVKRTGIWGKRILRWSSELMAERFKFRLERVNKSSSSTARTHRYICPLCLRWRKERQGEENSDEERSNDFAEDGGGRG